MVQIDLSSLDNVLEVDEISQTVILEPNCTIGQVTAELIPKGWTLAVVPELEDLTVGGLIMGFGVESSSHHHGLFQHTCVSFEIILSDGQIVKTSETENPELFAAIPWSYGSLGFLLSAEIKIVRAAPYVHITYLPCHSIDSIVSTFDIASRSPHFDFVELLQYSLETGVVMVGKMSNFNTASSLYKSNLAARPKINSIGNYYKPWFFKHVEQFLSSNRSLEENITLLDNLARVYSSPNFKTPGSREMHLVLEGFNFKSTHQELIPLLHYYHRHTKALFWELQDIIPFANHPLFRYVFGWAVPPHISFLKLTTTEKLSQIYDQAHVVQDMLVPMNTLKSSILKFHEELEIYPLWLCPMRLLSPPSKHFSSENPANVDINKKKNILPSDINFERHYDLVNSVPGFLSPTKNCQLYVDIGAYGVPMAKPWRKFVLKVYGGNISL